MGRAKAIVYTPIAASTPLGNVDPGASEEVEQQGNVLSEMANADSVSGNSDPASDFALTDSAMMDGFNSSLSETLSTPEYEPPSWAEFRTYVMDNGNRFVRASYPNPPVDLIETIWCGVPVEHHEHARVMTPKSEWLVY